MEDDQEIQTPGPSKMVYVKAGFLIFLIAIGMLFLNRASNTKPQQTAPEETPSKTLETILGVKDRVMNEDVLGQVTQQVEESGVDKTVNILSEQVKGEATKAADKAIEKTTNSTLDYVYDQTIVRVIEKLIESLPERQREQFVERMCE